MSADKKSHEWLKDFETFLKQEEKFPPAAVNQAVLAQVCSDLNPSLKVVVAKLFGLHAIGATIVALFCPQLGVGPIIGEHGIMHLFMYYGPLVCAALCGGIFLGISAILATIFLTREELRLANRYRFLNVTLLASLSFAGLMLAGGSADRFSYAFWILGAVVTGWSILKLGERIRLRPPSYQIRMG
ncbi:hypothetical protein K2X33_14785 [bacterium]|nr:hypothetical protein [bacterium]